MEFVKEMDDQKENLNVAFLNAAIRLNLKLLSVVFGTVSGLSLFVATLISHLNGGGDLLGLLSVFFIGYSVSIPGRFLLVDYLVLFFISLMPGPLVLRSLM